MKKRTLINPPGTEEFYNNWQFSQGVQVGDTVWLAGQLGIGPDGKPGATIEEQTRFAFQNVERVLATAGGSLADIAEITTYHIAMSDLPKVAAVKAEFIKEDFPAWTAVGVTQLALPEMLKNIAGVRDQIHMVTRCESLAALEEYEEQRKTDTGWNAFVAEVQAVAGTSETVDHLYRVAPAA